MDWLLGGSVDWLLGGFSGFGHWVGSVDLVIGWVQWIWSLSLVSGLVIGWVYGFGH